MTTLQSAWLDYRNTHALHLNPAMPTKEFLAGWDGFAEIVKSGLPGLLYLIDIAPISQQQKDDWHEWRKKLQDMVREETERG